MFFFLNFGIEANHVWWKFALELPLIIAELSMPKNGIVIAQQFESPYLDDLNVKRFKFDEILIWKGFDKMERDERKFWRKFVLNAQQRKFVLLIF